MIVPAARGVALVAIALVGAGGCTDQNAEGRPFTPQAVRALAESDKRAALQSKFIDDHWWELMRNVAAGSEDWIDAAIELAQYSDAESSELLGAAIGEALATSPAVVLAAIANDRVRARYCTFTFENVGADAPSNGILENSLAERRAAVAAVPDPALNDAKAACLEEIDAEIRRSAPNNSLDGSRGGS